MQVPRHITPYNPVILFLYIMPWHLCYMVSNLTFFSSFHGDILRVKYMFGCIRVDLGERGQMYAGYGSLAATTKREYQM